MRSRLTKEFLKFNATNEVWLHTDPPKNPDTKKKKQGLNQNGWNKMLLCFPNGLKATFI